MAKQSDYTESKGKLADLLKNKSVVTPIQEVRPIQDPPPTIETPKEKKKEPHEGETHVNFWTETHLFERLRLHAFMSRKSIRQIATEALDLYLKQHGR